MSDSRVTVCEARTDCADPNVNRWYCLRGHEGAVPGVCPLRFCDLRGANATTEPGLGRATQAEPLEAK